METKKIKASKKHNVLKIIYLGITLLILTIWPCKTNGYENYGEVQEKGVVTCIEGVRTFTVHYQNWMYYTINTHTPGYIETGVYNTRENIGDNAYEINIKPFFRWRAGPMIETGKPLDMYLDANSRGFFIVQLPTTLAYTRDGRFVLDSQRRVVSLSGYYPLQGEEGDIVLPEGNDILISRSGLIYVDGQPITRVKIAVFKSFTVMQTLESLNGSVFVATRELETLEGPEHYAVIQGALEQNNILKAITGDIGMAKNGYDVSVKTAYLINRALSTAAGLAAP